MEKNPGNKKLFDCLFVYGQVFFTIMVRDDTIHGIDAPVIERHCEARSNLIVTKRTA